jgi:excisionase family DNA binding protein
MSTKKGESGERLLISTSEAARMLSIGKTSLFRIISSGELKVVRLGGGGIVRVPVAEIRRIASGESVGSGGDEAA